MSEQKSIGVVMCIHAECDKDIKWNIRYPLKFRSIVEIIPSYFENIFRRFSVKPTYLISSEVFDHKESVDILLAQREKAELGTHFHGEFLEPGRISMPRENKDYGCLYEEHIERAKLIWLTQKFEETFGFRPQSFAAGRWGATGRTARILSDLGYIADSSVVSFMNRRHLGLNEMPLLKTGETYFPSEASIVSSGNLKLVEIPVTALPASKLYSGPFNYLKLMRSFYRNRKGTDKLIWLRPTFSSFGQMKKLIDTVIATQNSDIVFNMMFHSFEAVPGLSPYVKTKEESRVFIKRLETILKYLAKKKSVFMTLKEVANKFIQKNQRVQ